MAEVMPKDLMIRIGARTMFGADGKGRHGSLVVAGARRGMVDYPYTFTRADATTCATYIDRNGVLRLAAANVPRIEWVDLDGDGIRETPGIVFEGSRQNKFLRSEEFDNAAWSHSAGETVTANTDVAPDGTTTMDTLSTDGSNGDEFFNQNVGALSGAVICSSLHVQQGSTTGGSLLLVDTTAGLVKGRVDMTWAGGVPALNTAGGEGGALGFGVIGPINGSYRIWFSRDGLVNGNSHEVRIYPSGRNLTSAKTLKAWGAQLEFAAFPSSYMKTVAALVTRAPDSLVLLFNFGPMDFTALMRVARPVWADIIGALGTQTLLQISTTNPILDMGSRSGVREFYSRITPSGNVLGGVIPAGTSMAFAAQFKNLKTAGQTQIDPGTGFGGFGAAEPAFQTFGNQTLRLNLPGSEYYGVVLDIPIFRDLHTLAEVLALP